MATCGRATAFVLVAALIAPVSAQEPEPPPPSEPEHEHLDWTPGVQAARRYAKGRLGRVRFAVIDDMGRTHRYRSAETVAMASVLKVMLMTGYLRRPSVRSRPLRQADKDLLAPMIRWSDNATATRIFHMLGHERLHRLARKAKMRDFAVGSPWGNSRTSARDQVRFMKRLHRYLPDRHEGYARRLLRTIVRSQRWGIARVVPDGWRLFFKGGWGSGTGSVCHQVAFLESEGHRIAVAIMITSSPDHDYATRTLRGVARRLLRGLPVP